MHPDRCVDTRTAATTSRSSTVGVRNPGFGSEQQEIGTHESFVKTPRAAARFAGLVLAAAFPLVAAGQAAGKLDRTVLPIPEPKRPLYTELDARNVKAPPRFEVKAPPGAPNVVIVLIDDLGFGAPSTFGGPIATPTLDRLAQDGLRYNNFHTTALCSPTRAALKSGRNHHTVNMGFITEMATAFPGATGQIPNATAPLAEMLRLNGYSTARLRQVARDGGVGGQRLRPLRPLADAPGLRQVLRLHRRRDQPVGAVPLRRRHARSNCRTTRTTTS